jgi:hypothetical protein
MDAANLILVTAGAIVGAQLWSVQNSLKRIAKAQENRLQLLRQSNSQMLGKFDQLKSKLNTLASPFSPPDPREN